ncbi:integral membrane protein [Rhexocercosporidium sp. MPI-PUGE-AT-0058]|nr:integral membrane protein [Rhexocercosporidium sp. MPI-PUGE-AT-0058]
MTSTANSTTTYSQEFLNQETGNLLTALSALFIALNTIFLALRFYARSTTPRGTGWDDVFIVFSYVANIALCIVSILIVPYGGVGLHLARVKMTNPHLLTGWAKGILAIELIYLTAVALPKLSVLCLYLRIFTTKSSRRLAQAIIIFIAVNWAAFMVAVCFQCIPLAYWWDRTIPGGKCFNVQAFYRIMCVPNIVTDIVVMVLPIKVVVELKLPTIKKIALFIVFLTASFGLVASVIRFTVFFKTDAFTDRTWESVPLVGWSVVEAGMYLIAACLPLLRPILTKHAPKWLKNKISSTFKTYSNSRSHDLQMNALNSNPNVSVAQGKQNKFSESETKLVNGDKEIAVTIEISQESR